MEELEKLGSLLKLESLLYDILTDLQEDDTDNATQDMCNECLIIVEKLKDHK